MRQKILLFLLDIVLAVLVFLGIWVVAYKLPQKGQSAVYAADVIQNAATQEAQTAKNTGTADTPALPSPETADQLQENVSQVRTTVKRAAEDWHTKFADQFTDTVVATDTSYTSPDLAIHLTYDAYDTGKLDTSSGGKHLKYGSCVSYVLADVYVGDITCLQTVFAQDTYGVGFSEKLTDMSARMQAVLAVNGDSYSNDRHKDNGTIIRNGVVYRDKPSDAETCVLNWDGTMDIYAPYATDLKTLVEKGAYQSWIFGPSLLDETGKAKKEFVTWDYIKESHPRTAIGYYEPGHYCFLLVDGRQKDSRGMFPEEMAAVFEKLGCKAAYNLDGGHCSFMTLQNTVVNHPYKPEHTIPDGIVLREAI